MTPLGTDAVPQPRSRVPPDTDIGDYINDVSNNFSVFCVILMYFSGDSIHRFRKSLNLCNNE